MEVYFYFLDLSSLGAKLNTRVRKDAVRFGSSVSYGFITHILYSLNQYYPNFNAVRIHLPGHVNI